jgi:hypothetical protein
MLGPAGVSLNVGQYGFWDKHQRFVRLHDMKMAFKSLSDSIPWEFLRPLFDKGYAQESKNNAGRKRIDHLILIKILVLQRPFTIFEAYLPYLGACLPIDRQSTLYRRPKICPDPSNCNGFGEIMGHAEAQILPFLAASADNPAASIT